MIQEAIMRRTILLVSIGLLAAVVLVVGVSSAQAPASQPAISNLDKPINDCEREVRGWKHAEVIEIVVLAMTCAVGVLISGLQKSVNPSAKQATVVLGFVTAILTGINSIVFPADVKTLRRAVSDGSAVIRQLWTKSELLKSGQLKGTDLKAATEDFAKELSRFQAVADTLNGSTTATRTSWNITPFSLPVVYAQSQSSLPEWTRSVPYDKAGNRYFVGKASNASLVVAKQNSIDAAVYNAATALIPAVPHVSRSALLDLIKASAVTQDSAFVYKDGSYECYTLLRLSPQVLDLAKALPATSTAALTVFQANGWQPADLTENAASGLFALDKSGAVSKLTPGQQGAAGIQKLFQIPGAMSGYAIAANADSVFLAAGSQLGCTIYRYTLASKMTTSLLMAAHQRCVGIANDGTNLYVSMPERKEIRYWSTWDASSPRNWSLSKIQSPGNIGLDETGHRLIVADDATGQVYAVSIPDGKEELLSGNVGAVQSIATSRFHTLLASGKQILFLARSNNQGENPPHGWPALPGGNIVGVAVDSSDKLWIADYDKKVVEGPLPLI